MVKLQQFILSCSIIEVNAMMTILYYFISKIYHTFRSVNHGYKMYINHGEKLNTSIAGALILQGYKKIRIILKFAKNINWNLFHNVLKFYLT